MIDKYHISKFELKLAVSTVGVLLLIVAGLMPGQINAGTNSVVSIYVDNEKQVVRTDAETVGEALERAEIKVDEHDLVEPSPTAEITNQVFNINVYRAVPVLLVDGENQHRIESAYGSPRLMAENSGVVDLYEEDRVEAELIQDFLSEGHVGYKVTIDRAVPFSLQIGDKTTTMRTHGATVGEMFAEAGIEISEHDIVQPKLETAITAGMEVALTQVGFETVTEEIEVAPETKTVRDNNRPLGYEKIEEEGRLGVALATYRIELRNGKEVGREEIRRVVERDAEPRVVVVGNKLNYSASENREIGRLMAAERGWTGSQWTCLDTLWGGESEWRHTVSNYQGSGAYGIAQALPGSKMASHGSDWATNPRTQIAWGLDYITNRYTNPCGAYNFWLSKSPHWY
ncbi:MAG: ubiquitin-like domain-containing protein [Candidatus Saccharimonadales bacterium]